MMSWDVIHPIVIDMMNLRKSQIGTSKREKEKLKERERERTKSCNVLDKLTVGFDK